MPDRLDQIRARAAAATPGPWHWGGNVDHSCPSLRARRPGFGTVEVLGTMPVERTAQDRAITGYLDEVDDDEGADALEAYLRDQWGDPIRDQRLTFTVDGLLVEARRLGVFEVAPQATQRDDRRVYRADIVDVRHPDARFIAAARADVEWLIAEVDRLRVLVDEQPAAPVTAAAADHVGLEAALDRQHAAAAMKPPAAPAPKVVVAAARTEYL